MGFYGSVTGPSDKFLGTTGMNIQVPQKMEFLDELSNCQVLKKGLYHTAMQYCSNIETINRKDTYL
jgi:hypothetical protein